MCFHFTAPLVEKPSKLAPNGFERTPNGYSSDLHLAPTTTSTISVESYWNCFTEPPLLATNRFSLDTLGRLLAEREGSDVRTYLLKHRAVVVRYRYTDGVSALHVACEMGREAAVRVLCEELHMSIEVTDSLGRSLSFWQAPEVMCQLYGTWSNPKAPTCAVRTEMGGRVSTMPMHTWICCGTF